MRAGAGGQGERQLTPRVIDLVVLGDPLSQISVNRMRRFAHWAQRSKLVKVWRARAAICWMLARERPFTGKVKVTYTVCRPRRLDPDKALAGLAPLIDGMSHPPVGYGVIPDDSSEWVEYAPVEWLTGNEWKGKEEVRVHVEEIS